MIQDRFYQGLNLYLSFVEMIAGNKDKRRALFLDKKACDQILEGGYKLRMVKNDTALDALYVSKEKILPDGRSIVNNELHYNSAFNAQPVLKSAEIAAHEIGQHSVSHYKFGYYARSRRAMVANVIGAATGLAGLATVNTSSMIGDLMGGTAIGAATAFGIKKLWLLYDMHEDEKWAYRHQGAVQYALDPKRADAKNLVKERQDILARKTPLANFAELASDIFIDKYPSKDKRDLYTLQGKEHCCASNFFFQKNELDILVDNTRKNVMNNRFKIDFIH